MIRASPNLIVLPMSVCMYTRVRKIHLAPLVRRVLNWQSVRISSSYAILHRKSVTRGLFYTNVDIHVVGCIVIQ